MNPLSLSWVVSAVIAATPAKATDSIVAEGIISAPVAAVWNAWATSAGLRSWLAPHADIDLRIDGLLRSNYDSKGSLDDAGTIENRVLAFEPERMLAIKVSKAPDTFPFKTRIGQMWTVLYLQPAPGGRTSLRIVGMGFGSDEESQKMRAFFKQGNEFTLTQLQKRFAQ